MVCRRSRDIIKVYLLKKMRVLASFSFVVFFVQPDKRKDRSQLLLKMISVGSKKVKTTSSPTRCVATIDSPMLF